MNLNFNNVNSIFFNGVGVSSIDINGVEAWRAKVSTPFYVENTTSSSISIYIKKNISTAPSVTIEKSSDGVTWETVGTTSTSNLYIQVPRSSKVYLRSNTTGWSKVVDGEYRYNYFSSSGRYNVGGNIMSLLYGSNFTGYETRLIGGFCRLFYKNTNLWKASTLLLPATTLVGYCYAEMFCECTSLTTAPILPATTLAGYCYWYMFAHCTSLTTAPVLPAITLVERCYGGMFSTCTSLTAAPELPATTLVESCYDSMFINCSALRSVKCLAENKTATHSTYQWLESARSTGTFTKKTGVSWPSGVSGIPTGWTVIEV